MTTVNQLFVAVGLSQWFPTGVPFTIPRGAAS